MSVSHHHSISPQTQSLVEPLTNREVEILHFLVQRLQNKEIAEKLFISSQTVKTHLQNIYQKLNASNRRMAVSIARDLNIL
jgi:DNA-binding NarL/FixJ family response regulator